MKKEDIIKEEINKSNIDPQDLAAQTTEGPLLIIAGPGSGKTYTLIKRIMYLIKEKNVQPENIFVSTFTEKAAKELITRVSNSLKEYNIKLNLNEMYIGTMHSIFLRILEENREYTRLKRNYRVLDQFDQQYFIYQNIREFEKLENIDTIIPYKISRWDKSEKLMGYINKVGEEYLDIYALKKSKDLSIKTLGIISEKYRELLEDNNLLDFTTIQVDAYNLLSDQPEVLNSLQEKIKYIMVDEYQDTNTIQEMILLKLADKNKNICVVGDDDQSLYRFRGATVRNILEFPNNFSKDECKKIYLTTNYRSHPDIINFYNKWMETNNYWEVDGNTYRFVKNMEPEKDRKSIDNPAVIKVSGDDGKKNWGKEVYSFLKKLIDTKKLTDYNQVAFLFRSVKNPDIVDLAYYLENKGINVFSPRSNMFFDREEIRLMIGAIFFMFPKYMETRKWNDTAHLDIWKYYDDCFKEFADNLREDENKDLRIFCSNFANIHTNLKNNTDYAFTGLFYQLLQYPLFSRYIIEDMNTKVNDLRPSYNLALFSQLLSKYEYLENLTVFTPKYIDNNITNFFNQFLRYLIDGGITEYEDFDEYVPAGCVSFMTIHQSKGLEFPIVIVDSLYQVPRKDYDEIDEILQNNYYHKKPFEPLENIKFYDFYRLYYTAFSRAQNLLVLSGQEKFTGHSKIPSKYFKPVFDDLISWKDKSFDINKLKLEFIKEVNIKNQYAFTSHILLYLTCPLQYKFFKELEFNAVRKGHIAYGVLIHQTIEDIHKSALTGKEDLITEQNMLNWFNANYESLKKSERMYLTEPVLKGAFDQALSYANRHQGNWDRIKEAEVDVSIVKDDYILTGKIDLIKGENDTVEIVDFKTDDKLDVNDPKDKEKLERHRKQLEIYSHIVEERTGYDVSKLHLYYTKETQGNPYINFKRSDLSIDETIKEFGEVVTKIEKKDFIIKERPDEKVCANCDMRFYCDRNV